MIELYETQRAMRNMRKAVRRWIDYGLWRAARDPEWQPGIIATGSQGEPGPTRTLSEEEGKRALAAAGVPDDKAEAFWSVVRDNITVLDDVDAWWTLMRDGADPLVDPEDADFIRQAMPLLPETVTPDTWGEWTTAVKAATGRKGKGLFMPLRKAVTGQERGPEMAALLPLLQVIRARNY